MYQEVSTFNDMISKDSMTCNTGVEKTSAKKEFLTKLEMISNGMRQLEEDAKEQVDYGLSQALEHILFVEVQATLV